METAPERCSEFQTKTKHFEIRNVGAGSIVLASLLEELENGHVLMKGEKFVLDMDNNRPEYINLHDVLVQAIHGKGLVQVTYIEEVEDGPA